MIPDVLTAKTRYALLRLAVIDEFESAPDSPLVGKGRELCNSCDDYAKWLYTLPHINEYINAWTIDIRFGNEIPSFVSNKENTGYMSLDLNDDDIELLANDPVQFTARKAGPLISTIEEDLNDFGFNVTERGFSDNGGHIGFACNDDEKSLVIDHLWFTYGKALESSLIMPVIAWFHPTVKGLWEREEIEEFLDVV